MQHRFDVTLFTFTAGHIYLSLEAPDLLTAAQAVTKEFPSIEIIEIRKAGRQ